MIINVIILLIVIFIIYVRIRFINKDTLFSILSDKDYLNKFTKQDMYVRGVKSIEEYTQKNIRESVSSPSLFEKLRLIWLTFIIDLKILIGNNNKAYFDKVKFTRIPWKIGVVNGNLYEAGFPHTRNGNIIFSRNSFYTSNQDLSRVLLHEKVHVYQYLYKKDAEKYIKSKNLKRIKRGKNVRANPDIDDYSYQDSSGNIYQAVYRKNAKSIGDVYYDMGKSQYYEHPYESMAIEMEKMLK